MRRTKLYNRLLLLAIDVENCIGTYVTKIFCYFNQGNINNKIGTPFCIRIVTDNDVYNMSLEDFYNTMKFIPLIQINSIPKNSYVIIDIRDKIYNQTAESLNTIINYEMITYNFLNGSGERDKLIDFLKEYNVEYTINDNNTITCCGEYNIPGDITPNIKILSNYPIIGKFNRQIDDHYAIVVKCEECSRITLVDYQDLDGTVCTYCKNKNVIKL